MAIPTAAFSYPDTSYLQGGVNSGAETMVFYFAPDTTTARADDYALFRKVNDGAPAVVARNLMRTPGRPFFEYLYLMDHDTSAATVEVWSNVVVAHTAAVHGRPDGARPDTGAAALIDRIRGVRVNLTATDGTTGAGERRRSVSRTVLLANAGVTRLESCGEVPTFGGSFGAAPSAAGAATPTVTLSWGPAVDESGGEKDVLRYIVWKRPAGGGDWGPPFMSIPAGLPGYAYVDDQVQHGQTYDYAISAQDCTPSQSAQILATVRVP
jgi:hypothetical protein